MSFLKHRHRGKHIKALWPGSSSKAAASTDNIPRQPESDARSPLLSRRPSDPMPRTRRQRSTTTLRSTVSDSTTPPPVTMAKATIGFSRPGLQAPVFVVTSLSTPPWDVLEMNVDDQKTDSGDLVFKLSFDHVAEGTYQYKIRTGGSHWVIDDSQETATDDQGNCNNVVHVQAATLTAKPTISEKPGQTTAGGGESSLLNNVDTLFNHESFQENNHVRPSEPDLLNQPNPLLQHESFNTGPYQEDGSSPVETPAEDPTHHRDEELIFEIDRSPTFPHELKSHYSQSIRTNLTRDDYEDNDGLELNRGRTFPHERSAPIPVFPSTASGLAPAPTGLNIVTEESAIESDEEHSPVENGEVSTSTDEPSQKHWSELCEPITSPTKPLEPFTRPATSDPIKITPAPSQPSETENTAVKDEEPLKKNLPAASKDRTPTPTDFDSTNGRSEDAMRSFFRVVFGPTGRFLASCFSKGRTTR
ncbi:hypothetical protein P154DRAFT_574894 [Amniculicola lignicola CBS 123094]|uniref:AMP-activated protein kinase glycogen-binding domain-containing protein n=1 Tax=Amniculicola lignicola CBS 123094 TaxID=1392246 RepID=A0A6A5WJC6_9PLEO|nr:hypothetical protein P154DRAFT_574894 [Amniculicola lignicola CBS 123094]